MWPFIWTNLNSLYQGLFCAKFDWNWPSGSEEDFKKLYNYFYSVAIISLLKGKWPFNCINLNLPHTRMLCAKFGWNWPNDSREEDKNVKNLWWKWRWQHLWRQTMEKFIIEKLTWAFSSGELKGVQYKVNCYMIVTWHREEYSCGRTSFSHFHWVLHLASFQ